MVAARIRTLSGGSQCATADEKDGLVLKCYTEDYVKVFVDTEEISNYNKQLVTQNRATVPANKSVDDDIWNLPDIDDDSSTSWSALDRCGKVRRVFVEWLGKMAAVPLLLFFFICSLDLLASSFRLLGGKAAGQAFANNELMQNPICGLMLGILGTVLVQSSSTSTSIVITMVASGLLEVSNAVPIIMGANIGTSVTNTIVSMAQSGDRNQFRRAFAGATVHDMFNWLSVAVILPLECATGYLQRLTALIVDSMNLQSQDADRDFLKVLTKPFTQLVVMLDKKVIEGIATNQEEYMHRSLLKTWCAYTEVTTQLFLNGSDVTAQPENVTELVGVEKCDFLLQRLGLGDTMSGLLLLVVSLFLLCGCLILLVKILNSILKGRIAKVIRKFINSELPGHCSCFTGYVAILVGAVMTVLVQSSSVFTSALTPLVGMGVIRLERMYPLTLGSNIGTTGTGMLAALAAPGDKISAALQIALVHLFFNVTGILLFYPVPYMRWPIGMAKKLGEITATYRWFAIFYLIVMFFLIPCFVFALSLLHTVVFFVVIALIISAIVLPALFYVIVSKMQTRYPQYLPKYLQSWSTVPVWQRMLQPIDNVLIQVKKLFSCCKRQQKGADDVEEKELESLAPSSGNLLTDSDCALTAIVSESCLGSNESACSTDSGFSTLANTPCQDRKLLT